MRNKVNSNRLPEGEIVARVINNFIIKERRARYLAITQKPNPNGGYGFGQLAHFTSELDLRYCKQIPSGYQYVGYVLKEIKALTKTADCYIIHECKALDGKWMNIEDALNEIVGSNLGAFIIIDNGDIIYHESENIKERYIGVRQKSH